VKIAEGEIVCVRAPCPQPVHVTFDAEDANSPIAHAEYSLDAGPWQFVQPVGELSDSKREHYDFRLPEKALEGKTVSICSTVRAYDRHDNVGVARPCSRFRRSNAISRRLFAYESAFLGAKAQDC